MIGTDGLTLLAFIVTVCMILWLLKQSLVGSK